MRTLHPATGRQSRRDLLCALLNFEWVHACRPKTELAREQENGSRSAQASAGAFRSRLEQPIERFAIGLSNPSHDAIEVLPDLSATFFMGSTLERMTFVHHCNNMRRDDVDLLALQNLAQLLPVLPSAQPCAGWSAAEQLFVFSTGLGLSKSGSRSSFQPLSMASRFARHPPGFIDRPGALGNNMNLRA